MTTHIITHGGCPDGFTSRWLLNRYLERAYRPLVFHDGVYGEEPPLDAINEDDSVIIADFSYPRAQMYAIADKAWHTIVLDHHKTAEADLAGIADYLDDVDVIFDMDRSGAGLTWSFLDHPNEVKDFVGHVEQADLWHPDRDLRIQALLGLYPMTFDAWDDLWSLVEYEIDTAVMVGDAVLARNRKIITEQIREARLMMIGGREIPTCQSLYSLGSLTAEALALDHPGKVGAYYVDKPECRQFGLRSLPDGPDVSEIAQAYGGGGHAHASGFRVEWGHLLAPDGSSIVAFNEYEVTLANEEAIDGVFIHHITLPVGRDLFEPDTWHSKFMAREAPRTLSVRRRRVNRPVRSGWHDVHLPTGD